jgi:hypothetical protein
MAKVIIHGSEKLVILGVRELLWQPFEAGNWTDLRVGFFVSVCSATVDDPPSPITGLAESIAAPGGGLAFSNRVGVGVADTQNGGNFFGFTNVGQGTVNTTGATNLVSSDGGIGVTNSNFWRYNNGLSDNFTVAIIDLGQPILHSADGSQMHLPQNTIAAGGYTALWCFRVQRGVQGDSILTFPTSAGHAGEALFTNTPDLPTLSSTLANFPSTVQQLGPVSVRSQPSGLYVYWPFSLSRLRIHACGIYRSA